MMRTKLDYSLTTMQRQAKADQKKKKKEKQNEKEPIVWVKIARVKRG